MTAPTAARVRAVVEARTAELLGLPAVDMTANFFALGGDSLTGVDLCDAVAADLGHEVLLEELFDAPSLDAFADRLLDGSA